jgi:hypothetical protein
MDLDSDTASFIKLNPARIQIRFFSGQVKIRKAQQFLSSSRYKYNRLHNKSNLNNEQQISVESHLTQYPVGIYCMYRYLLIWNELSR